MSSLQAEADLGEIGDFTDFIAGKPRPPAPLDAQANSIRLSTTPMALKTRLARRIAFVELHDEWIEKHFRGGPEIDAMLLAIGLLLGIVPIEVHRRPAALRLASVGRRPPVLLHGGWVSNHRGHPPRSDAATASVNRWTLGKSSITVTGNTRQRR